MNSPDLPVMIRLCAALIWRWLQTQPHLHNVTIERLGTVVVWQAGEVVRE